MSERGNLKSTCCFANITVQGITSKYAVCSKCKQPCNITFKSRKQWGRKPQTQVIPNKKKQSKTRLTKKEETELKGDF